MQWYDACLGSLLSSTIPLEIICIDNKSTDDTVNYINKNFPQIRIIQNNTNTGFAHANNVGLKFAYDNGDDFFFLLNQDAWIENNTIEKLIKFSIKNSEYGIISPIHLNGSKNNFDLGFLRYFSKSETLHAYENLYLGKAEPACYDTKFVNAAAWLITKKCLEMVGGFDTSVFKHYGEDVNYCHRVLFHNFKIGIVPSATICHDRENRSPPPGMCAHDLHEVSYFIQYTDVSTSKKHFIKNFFCLLINIFYKNSLREIIFFIKNILVILKSRKINKTPRGGFRYIENLSVNNHVPPAKPRV